jgi:hypothetical protein
MNVVVDDVFGHQCGKIVTEGRNLLVNIDEKCIGGPTTKDLDGAVWYAIEVEGHGAACT